MEKSILILSILLILANSTYCQEALIMTESPDSKQIERNIKSEKIDSYYFHNTLIDSSVFFQDSIELYEKPLNSEDSKIDLFDDSMFVLTYNIKFENITRLNTETGEMESLTLKSSDEVYGKYGILLIQNSQNGEGKKARFRFILSDSNVFDFNIKEQNNQMLLVKIK